MNDIRFSLLFSICLAVCSANGQSPVRIGVVGLTHDHVHGILNHPASSDIQIVGIAESNKPLAIKYSQRYHYDPKIVYATLEEMIAATKPEAVTVFGPISEHLKAVQVCAPLGIHVMVEKPLATSLADANEMIALAKKYNIQLITNYETTWYATNQRAYELINEQSAIGEIRKVVVHDGHPGPKEIGCSAEFLSWLTDPVQNGGGAIMDFGCYGADLITWLMKGEMPTSVMAVTQQIKPSVYPRVDDEATIIVTYPKTQGIIQASWNWPVSRKDMEVYGEHGYVMSDNKSDLRFRKNEKDQEIREKLGNREKPYNEPFGYFAAVVRKKIVVNANDLSSMETNQVAMQILNAAKESARSGKIVLLK